MVEELYVISHPLFTNCESGLCNVVGILTCVMLSGVQALWPQLVTMIWHDYNAFLFISDGFLGLIWSFSVSATPLFEIKSQSQKVPVVCCLVSFRGFLTLKNIINDSLMLSYVSVSLWTLIYESFQRFQVNGGLFKTKGMFEISQSDSADVQ